MQNKDIKKNIKISNWAYSKIKDALKLLNAIKIDNDYETYLWKLEKAINNTFQYLSKNIDKCIIDNSFNQIIKDYEKDK